MAGKQGAGPPGGAGGADSYAPFGTDVADLCAGFGDRHHAPPSRAGAPEVVTVKQVHGTRIATPQQVRTGEADEADALVVDGPGTLVAIRTADCVPVLLLADGPTRFAAAVHAGWRGTLADITGRAVEAAVARGVDPARLRAAIGPAIGPCCYEVGEDLASRFAKEGLPVVETDDRPRLDLRAINVIRLERAGLSPGRIRLAGPCTRCRNDRYWSYRAQPLEKGRQLSWIGWEGRDA